MNMAKTFNSKLYHIIWCLQQKQIPKHWVATVSVEVTVFLAGPTKLYTTELRMNRCKSIKHKCQTNSKQLKGEQNVYTCILSQLTLIKKHAQKWKGNPWSAAFYYLNMGLKGSEYHASFSVSQSTLTHSTHSSHGLKCLHTSTSASTPWTTEADIRQNKLQQDWTTALDNPKIYRNHVRGETLEGGQKQLATRQ